MTADGTYEQLSDYEFDRPTPHRDRLPVRADVHEIQYHRPPTASELRFGEGATHYRTFALSECCHPKTRVPKRWFIAADDGLRYYYD